MSIAESAVDTAVGSTVESKAGTVRSYRTGGRGFFSRLYRRCFPEGHETVLIENKSKWPIHASTVGTKRRTKGRQYTVAFGCEVLFSWCGVTPKPDITASRSEEFDYHDVQDGPRRIGPGRKDRFSYATSLDNPKVVVRADSKDRDIKFEMHVTSKRHFVIKNRHWSSAQPAPRKGDTSQQGEGCNDQVESGTEGRSHARDDADESDNESFYSAHSRADEDAVLETRAEFDDASTASGPSNRAEGPSPDDAQTREGVDESSDGNDHHEDGESSGGSDPAPSLTIGARVPLSLLQTYTPLKPEDISRLKKCSSVAYSGHGGKSLNRHFRHCQVYRVEDDSITFHYRLPGEKTRLRRFTKKDLADEGEEGRKLRAHFRIPNGDMGQG